MNTHPITIFTSGKKATYNKGSTILSAHEKRDHIFYIVSGWIKVVQNNNFSSEKILTTLQQGDIFPFEWTKPSTQETSFVALEETKTLAIPLAKFKERVTSSPHYTETIMDVIIRQHESLIHEITNLQYHSAREKLILRLLSLASDFGQKKGKLIYINKNISNEYMAKSTSMSRETTSREMSKLIRERLIRHSPKGITLLDVESLNKQLGNVKTPYHPCMQRHPSTRQHTAGVA